MVQRRVEKAATRIYIAEVSAARQFLMAKDAAMKSEAKNNWLPIFVALGTLLFLFYVISYLALSRRGYAQAQQFGMKGFYYVPPEDSDGWRFKNNACIILFWPLNTVDRAIGRGRPPAAEPMWNLSQ